MFIKKKLGKYIVNRKLENLHQQPLISVFEASSGHGVEKIRFFCKKFNAFCFKAKGKILRKLLEVGRPREFFKYFKGDFVLVFAMGNAGFLKGVYHSDVYTYFMGALENNVYYTRGRLSFIYSKKIDFANILINPIVPICYLVKINLLYTVLLCTHARGI
jgi:hypothetical protein